MLNSFMPEENLQGKVIIVFAIAWMILAPTNESSMFFAWLVVLAGTIGAIVDSVKYQWAELLKLIAIVMSLLTTFGLARMLFVF